MLFQIKWLFRLVWPIVEHWLDQEEHSEQLVRKYWLDKVELLNLKLPNHQYLMLESMLGIRKWLNHLLHQILRRLDCLHRNLFHNLRLHQLAYCQPI